MTNPLVAKELDRPVHRGQEQADLSPHSTESMGGLEKLCFLKKLTFLNRLETLGILESLRKLTDDGACRRSGMSK